MNIITKIFAGIGGSVTGFLAGALFGDLGTALYGAALGCLFAIGALK